MPRSNVKLSRRTVKLWPRPIPQPPFGIAQADAWHCPPRFQNRNSGRRNRRPLYQLVTTIEIKGQVVDRKETTFGIRTVGFDANKGILAKRPTVRTQGHLQPSRHGRLRRAPPDALQYFRIAKLKEFGCNAYRTSHNPPTPELLDACDHLGMIVMDENRLLGGDEQNRARWEAQIRRDRNHASVGIWSLANEEGAVEDSVQGGNVARTMQDLRWNISIPPAP